MKKENLHNPSYQLGIIDAFAEVVAADVKKLALSSPLDPALYEEIKDNIKEIAEANGVHIFLEKDFLVTDLFPENIAKGKWVVFIYKQKSVLERYQGLKNEKSELLSKNSYKSEERRNIGFAFGELLSYSDEAIEKLLSKYALEY